MSVNGNATIERSAPFINDLIQDSAEAVCRGLTTTELAGELVVPTLIADPRERSTRLIVIAGGAASGKSTLAEAMSHILDEQDVPSAIISADDFVLGDRGARHRLEAQGMQPEEKYDFHAMRRAIGAVCANQDPTQTVEVPQYDSHTGLAIDGNRRQHIPRVGVLIVEGDMLGKQGSLPQDLCPDRTAARPLTIYTHVPDEARLARRIERDLRTRNGQGEDCQDIIKSFIHRQRVQHLPYTLTYASAADVIVTPAANTAPGVELHDMYTMPSGVIVANCNRFGEARTGLLA